MTTEDYLTQLQQDREDLVDNLEAKGITGLTGDETFTELVPEVLNIPSGGNKFSFINEGGIRINIQNGNCLLTNQQLQDEFNNIVTNIDINSITSIERMFYYCMYLQTIDFSNLKMNNLKIANEVFSACNALTTANFSNFNAPNLTSMSSIFKGNNNLTNVNFNNFNAPNLSNFDEAFYQCTSLTSIDFSNVNIPNCINFLNAFYNCSNLERADLSGFVPNNRNVRIGSMFSGCSKLSFLDIRGMANMPSSSSYWNGFVSGVPDNCLIIVKDDSVKSWFATNISRLTNVKTVEEYEASL